AASRPPVRPASSVFNHEPLTALEPVDRRPPFPPAGPTVLAHSRFGGTSPPARVISAASVLRVRFDDRNRTEPSPNSTLTPPVWKLYSSLSLVQFIGHGPTRAEPSALAPVGAIRLLRSAQLAAVS